MIESRQAVIRCLSGKGYEGNANVACPRCHCDYTHIKHVGTLSGETTEDFQVYPGTVSVGQSGLRRSAVQIVMECENCPGPFALVIQQHKGINGLSFSLDPVLPKEKKAGECRSRLRQARALVWERVREQWREISPSERSEDPLDLMSKALASLSISLSHQMSADFKAREGRLSADMIEEEQIEDVVTAAAILLWVIAQRISEKEASK